MSFHPRLGLQHNTSPAHEFLHISLAAVLSQDLQYLSGGSEIPEETQCTFSEDQREALGLTEDIAAVLPDILLAKMRPGQSIELEAHCTKGFCFAPYVTSSSRSLDADEYCAQLLVHGQVPVG